MNKTLKLVLVFFGSGTIMFLIFYFYPAKLFDVDLIRGSNSFIEEVHLSAFLGIDQRFEDYLSMYDYTLERRLSGWMIAFVCLIGLPLMLTYRASLSKGDDEKGEMPAEQESS
jgi:hypothetical protein